VVFGVLLYGGMFVVAGMLLFGKFTAPVSVFAPETV